MYLPPKSYLYIYTINHIIIQLFKKRGPRILFRFGPLQKILKLYLHISKLIYGENNR